jgi:hypothetical protein
MRLEGGNVDVSRFLALLDVGLVDYAQGKVEPSSVQL